MFSRNKGKVKLESVSYTGLLQKKSTKLDRKNLNSFWSC